MKFASHVIFQIHLKRWQKKPTPPRVFSYSARPSTWSTYISLAIVKEWYNVRVGLRGNKESTIEHLREPGRRDITVDATISISLCFRNQGRVRNRSPWISMLSTCIGLTSCLMFHDVWWELGWGGGGLRVWTGIWEMYIGKRMLGISTGEIWVRVKWNRNLGEGKVKLRDRPYGSSYKKYVFCQDMHQLCLWSKCLTIGQILGTIADNTGWLTSVLWGCCLFIPS